MGMGTAGTPGMTPLTKAEAFERSRLISVESYDITLDLSEAAASGTFESTTTIRFSCAEPGSATFAEIRPAALHSATLNGTSLPLSLDGGNRLPLAELAAGNELVVAGSMTYSRDGQGLHKFTDLVDGLTYVYAQTFLDDAQRVFACFDQPDLKAVVRLRIRAPKGWTVIANEAGGPGDSGYWEFAPTRPLATYFTAFAAGPFHSRYLSYDGLRLGVHARRSIAEPLDVEADEIFTVTRQSFDYYHALFGSRYPFGETYDQVFLPEYNAGAMENPGCVTFRDDLVFRSKVTTPQRQWRATTVSHEMAHMWFGDLVTTRWWDDLWLNESFADYMGNRCGMEATEFTGIATSVAIEEKPKAYLADQRPSTHPVSAEVEDTGQALLNFDHISYSKGCAALQQLAAYLGDTAFIAGLREHFARHAYANADLAGFLASLSAASGQDLDTWARVWLQESGVNVLRPHVSTSDGAYTSVSIEQTGSVLRPHRLRVGLYDLVDGSAVRRDSVPITITDGSTEIPALTGKPVADLLLLNDDDLTYARIRLDPDSLAALPDVVPCLKDPLPRALLFAALSDMVRDAEIPARDYITLAAACVPGETDVAILENVLREARRLADGFAPEAERTDLIGLLASACKTLLGTASPEGSVQLAAARGFAENAIEASDAKILHAWLQDRSVPSGLTMDSDLRWSVLLRLVVLGRAGAKEISAEMRNDDTTEGVEQAARCRAALPTAEAKAEAWRILMTDTTLSNHMLVETAEGFWQPEQAALTAPYVERYFAEIAAMAALREPEVVRQVATFAYPGTAVSPESVALADEFLARTELDPTLRRVVVDRGDLVRRALAARSAFPAP